MQNCSLKSKAHSFCYLIVLFLLAPPEIEFTGITQSMKPISTDPALINGIKKIKPYFHTAMHRRETPYHDIDFYDDRYSTNKNPVMTGSHFLHIGMTVFPYMFYYGTPASKWRLLTVYNVLPCANWTPVSIHPYLSKLWPMCSMLFVRLKMDVQMTTCFGINIAHHQVYVYWFLLLH